MRVFAWDDSRGGTRTKPGRDSRAARTEGATARKDERRAPESPRPGGNVSPPEPRQRRQGGADYS